MRILTVLVVLVAALAAFLLLRGLDDPAGDDEVAGVARTHAGRDGPRHEEGPPDADAHDPDGDAPQRPTVVYRAKANGRVHGVVLDEDGRPVAGAAVRLDAVDGSSKRGAPVREEPTLARTTAAFDGTFELALEETRWARVVAQAPGHGAAGLRVPGPGAFVELVLPPGGRVEVVVVDEDGAGVSDADVRVLAREVVHASRTDAHGRSTVEGVAAGPIAVEATAANLREGRVPPLALAPAGVTTVTILLRRAVSIAGRVIERGTDRGVPGAEVHLARPGLSIDAGPTAGDGAFGPVAAGVPGARLVVAVRAPGYAPALTQVLVPEVTDVHVVEIALERGTTWTGRVVDEAGRPVEGARVAYTAAGIAGREPDAATTDSTGGFALPPPSPPAPGRRVVLVAERDGRTAALALRPGDEPPHDLVFVLQRHALVSGRVADGEGTALAGVVVRLDPRWRESRTGPDADPHLSRLHAMNARGRLALSTTTDSSGRWLLRDVPDARYDVRVESARGPSWPATGITVSGTDVDLGTLVLGTGSELEGRVLDDAGRGVVGAAVTARSPEGHRVATATDASGAWRLVDLAIAEWDVSARMPGRLPASVHVALPHPEPVDLLLASGARLEGRVTDGDRPRARPFTVDLEREGARRHRVQQVFRDPAGRFQMDGLEAGTWRVRVQTPDGRGAESPAPITMRDGAKYEVALELAAGGRVGGTVCRVDGTPVAQAAITLTNEGSSRRVRATSDAAGAWQATGLPAGEWRVTARGPGGAPTETRVEVADGRQVRLDLALAAIGSLEVTVLGADGRRRAGAYVRIRRAEGPSPAWRRAPRTDADGRVLLPEVPTGELAVHVRTAKGEMGRTDVVVVAGETTRAGVTVTADVDSR